MKGHGQKWSRKKDQAVAALLTSPSIPAAARLVGIGESTLSRWLKLDSFQTEYRTARRQAVSQAVATVQATMASAATTLQSVMDDPRASFSVRVTAARAVLDFGIKTSELEDLEIRLRELEALLQRRTS
jgi:hypothetical protein